MELVYKPVIAAALATFKVMGWKVTIEGAHHVPASGPALLASNHIGYMDFVFVGYGARSNGRLVRFAAKKEVFDHPIAGPLMRGMKHLPVDRYGRALDAIKAGTEMLRRGEVVGMFPEGTISPSFVPQAARTGAARMAMNADAPLVPTAVWGTQRLMTKGRPRNLQRKVAISVAYGPPIDYRPEADAGEVTKRLMGAVGDLVEDLARSYPQEPAGDHDRWWLPAHLGGTAPSVEEADRATAEESSRRRARRRAERRAEREQARQAEGDGEERGE